MMEWAKRTGAAALWAGLAGAGVVSMGAWTVPALAQSSAVISANLFGDQVVGGGGSDEAVGDFSALVDRAAGQLCYYLEVADAGTVTAAHIHRGAQGKDGEAVMTLELAPDDERCVPADAALLDRLARDAKSHYVDVHTTDRPAGALRGQLQGK